MAQDFYHRAKALHEEFQQKELHYLHLERQLNSNISLKKDLNLPLQEYLQRINRREKKTEETYRNLMKQMEELDRHTELLSLKLEKLGVLKRNFSTFSLSNWPSLSPSNTINQEIYEGIGNFNTKTKNFASLQSLQPNLQSVATQTENIYCERCKSEVSSCNPLQNVDITKNLQSSSSLQSVSSNALKPPLSSDSHGNLLNSLAENNIAKQIASSSTITSHSFIPADVGKNIETEESKSVKQVYEIGQKESSESVVLCKEKSVPKHNSFGNILESKQDEVLVTSNEQNDASRNSELSKIDSEAASAEDIDVVNYTLKSDQESINHEFDFLEVVTPDMKENDIVKEDNESSSNKTIELKTDSYSGQQKQTNLKQKEFDKNALLENPMADTVSDNKSDLSLSITGPGSPHLHSSNISVASDSDSLSGKETPLKASAAYQALLGNTNIIEKRSKQIDSDSDSLNEVENVLANAVKRKSLVVSKASVQENKGEKFNPVQAETSGPRRNSKPAPGSKSQPKLSKDTKKLIGLNSSSSSEVELAVKAPGKKTEEESDEFDFYD